jgi:23S rRNA pseudouridine2605 synthase
MRNTRGTSRGNQSTDKRPAAAGRKPVASKRPATDKKTPTDKKIPTDKKTVTDRDKRKYIDYKIKVKKGDPLPSFNEDQVRLNKYLSNAGICSRREADVLIQTGVVSVNGKIITELGYEIAPEDVIQYDGETINAEVKRYVLLKYLLRNWLSFASKLFVSTRFACLSLELYFNVTSSLELFNCSFCSLMLIISKFG